MIEIDWNSPEDDGGSEVIEYIIYVGGNAVSSSTNTRFVYRDIVPGSYYDFAVSAVNELQEGN